MATVEIRGVPVSFPFEPYEIQKNYMEKVIEALQNEQNAVLESPTGTGKTLSLLCSSLAWLVQKKGQLQMSGPNIDIFSNIEERFSNQKIKQPTPKFMWDIPKIIYSSRTHSQLIQAMQELKRTSYSHVRASILGSRDQMCIHPEISKEPNQSNKIHMCRALVKARSCFLQNRVEKMSCNPEISEVAIVDIEDLIKLGEKNKFCPYYMSRELQKHADIIFLPYNYLLDPKARRAQQLDLKNSVVILDEAHNVEHICEDSASFQIKSTDITLCIEEVTQVMKQMDENAKFASIDDMDFSPDELIFLKTTLLNLEKAIDDVPIKNSKEGTTFEGKYIFEIFENAGINDGTQGSIVALLDKLIQLLSTTRDSPFQRTGNGLQLLQDLMLIVYQKTSVEFKQRINECYKVHLIVEDKEYKKKQVDTWLSKASSSKSKQSCRVLSYWCFSPGFGMNMLLELGVRSVILTSGTLAPLRPLISELGINVGVRLENPHVVSKQQICVKILSNGPDGVELNANFQNRNNLSYIMSLGMAIINIARMVPHGMLIFFPSYPVMSKCQEEWQSSEIWSSINQIKPIYVEPKTKDAFVVCMKEFYAKVKSPEHKGAIFMAVCRGKVSEGLDFADMNGRAVLITGLPYPPFKDPRIMLKKSYLDVLHSKDREYLTGQDWYSLEASRAVNQAIGRVIRHQYDYGAILLLDSRFNSTKIKSQMSLWLRDLIHPVKNFGEVIRDLRIFFKQAGEKFPLKENPVRNIPNNQPPEINYLSSPSRPSSSSGLVTIHRTSEQLEKKSLKRKFKMIDVNYTEKTDNGGKDDMVRFIHEMRDALGKIEYGKFAKGISIYRNNNDLDQLIDTLDSIFKNRPNSRMMLDGLLPYIQVQDREKYSRYCEKMKVL